MGIAKKDERMKWSRPLAARLLVGALCLVALVPHLPVNYFAITRDEDTILGLPVSNAASFVTIYIHSLQLTPVVDDYRMSCGTMWGWEELVQSHNAGLPYEAPAHGRFIVRSPWMIVRGGRRSFEQIAYRVGTAQLGKNIWQMKPFAAIKAYERYPSTRVTLQASVKTLKEARAIGQETADDIIDWLLENNMQPQ